MLSKAKQLVKKSKYILPSSTVLMFHHVTDKPITKKSILMSTKNFLSVIDSFNCYSDLRTAVENYKDKRIAVTFDDALLDVYTVAFPELTKRQIPFTIFVATDLLDQDGYISTKQLIELSKNPLVNIGSHCVSHTPMNGKNAETQKKELIDSKTILEKTINKKITEIAYPYGQCDKNTIGILKSSKLFDYGFLAAGGPINRMSSGNNMKLPRLRVDDKTLEKTMDILKYAYR